MLPEQDPCPFCGSTDTKICSTEDNTKVYIVCDACKATGPHADYELRAILDWNDKEK